MFQEESTVSAGLNDAVDQVELGIRISQVWFYLELNKNGFVRLVGSREGFILVR